MSPASFQDASRPAQGLVAAAFADGADTDTLAAMAGGMLGAINGDEWLQGIARHLQDASYLAAMSRNLIDAGRPKLPPAPRPKEIRRLWQTLAQTPAGSDLTLPDGRRAQLLGIANLSTRTRHEINVHTVRTDDGQTLFMKKVTRLQSGGDGVSIDGAPAPVAARPARARRPVVAIETDDLEGSVTFYRHLIGLELTRRTDDYVSFGGGVVVIPSNGAAPQKSQLELPGAPAFDSWPRLLVFVSSEAGAAAEWPGRGGDTGDGRRRCPRGSKSFHVPRP